MTLLIVHQACLDLIDINRLLRFVLIIECIIRVKREGNIKNIFLRTNIKSLSFYCKARGWEVT